MNRDLDIRDTTILKGMAISAIVFHNFFHWASPVRENEFGFDPARFQILLHTMRQPELAIQAFFSFFGHFGTQVFIFLSVYGLSRRYWDSAESGFVFLRTRIGKLYPAFGLIVIPWFIGIAAGSTSPVATAKIGLELVFMFLGLSTLMGYGLPPVGPWWFIPFILQLYVLWLLLRKITRRFGWPGLLVVSAFCLAVSCALNPKLAHWSVNLFMTPIGRMPTICFGILAARYPIRINAPLAIAALAVLLAGSRYAIFWPLTFLSALVIILWVYLKARETLRKCSFLERLGEYSMFIFLLNALVRDQLFTLATSPDSQLLYGCLSAVITFSVACGMHEFVNRRPAVTAEVPAFAAIRLASATD